MSRLDLRLRRGDSTACVTVTALDDAGTLVDEAREALRTIDGVEVVEP